MTDPLKPTDAGDKADRDIFDAVFAVIEKRKEMPPDQSYVAGLLSAGAAKINGKILEEAGEVCEAGLTDDRPHLTHEVCDLLFHVFVLAVHKGIAPRDLRIEMLRRFGTSGLVEKAGRTKS